MDILTKPLENFSFDNIVSFAKENHQEDVQLDYKEQFPDKEKLAQLVVAFANTRGGVIIVGIKENRENGRPVKFEGIEDGRHEEFIAQVISNISPIPGYETSKTNAHDGKIFFLIRVFEGSETPYYCHNDSNIWIRTGSTKKPVAIASPEHAELLFRKSERSHLKREQNKKLAWSNYVTFLKDAERKKQKKNQDNKAVNSPLLSFVLQPFYPHTELIRPLNLEPIIQQSEMENKHTSFPTRAVSWNSVQEGMIHFNLSDFETKINCQQVFANGLLFNAKTVVRENLENGIHTHLAWVASQLYVTLKGAKNILEKLGYQGTLLGEIKLEGIENVTVFPMGNMWEFENGFSVFEERLWPIKLDTRKLSNEVALREYVVDVVRDVHWTFGFKELQRGITVERLDKDGYFVT